jgi:hypothetical protein
VLADSRSSLMTSIQEVLSVSDTDAIDEAA